MTNIIQAGNATNGGTTITPDSSGALAIQTGSTPTTAVTFDASQNVQFANAINTPNTFGFKNRIINGSAQISQYNGTTAVSTSGYFVDRWNTGSISGGTFTVGQVADAPTGFQYSLKYTVTGTTTANDWNGLEQPVEANNCIDLAWGASNGTPMTGSFWVKSNNTGLVNGMVRFLGGSATYYYYFTYTINAANTWQYVTVSIPAPPTAAGAYAGANNGQYLLFCPFFVSTTGTTTTTGNTWTTTNTGKATGTISLASISSATIQATGVQLEKGTQATSFDYRPYGTELALCQRYFQILGNQNNVELVGGVNGTSRIRTASIFPVVMRAAPTFSISGTPLFYMLGTGSPTYSSINTSSMTTQTFMVDLNTSSSSLTAGQVANIQLTTASSTTFQFNAEL